jgi:hypothetical protein
MEAWYASLHRQHISCKTDQGRLFLPTHGEGYKVCIWAEVLNYSEVHRAHQQRRILMWRKPEREHHMLIMDNPAGTKNTPIILTQIEDFRPLRVGKQLFEDNVKNYVTYRGICSSTSVFLEFNSKLVRYYFAQGQVYVYDAGTPVGVKMQVEKLLNGDKVGSSDDIHAGVLYKFHVIWQNPNDNTKSGVLITEVIEIIEATGWFAQAQDQKQEIPISIAPGDTAPDILGISASPTSNASASNALPTSASATTEGTFTAFQHFEYIAQDTSSHPIPNSGFLITKTLKNGKLTVKREGAEKNGIKAGDAGEANGKTYEIEVKF